MFDDIWNARFMTLALLVADWSKDPRTRVGAAIISPNKRIISTGFNGFPSGVPDTEDHLSTPELKYARIVHAEVNAILNAKGVDLSEATMFCTMPSCNECAKVIIQSGLKRVIFRDIPLNLRWKEPIDTAMEMFEHAGVSVDLLQV